MDPQALQFGPFLLDPPQRRLTRNGESISLTPKAFDLLVLLTSRPGQILERAQILEAVWGDVNVEEAVLTQNIFTLRKALGEATYIETIPRKGYRFSAAVSALDPATPPATPSRRAFWVAGFGAVAAAAAGAFWLRSRPPDNLTGMAIAVLPLTNLTGDPALEYLSDGITEQISTTLARIPEIRVVGRTSAFQFKGKSGDLRDIASRLSAQVLLEGVLRREGDTFRISVQMVRAADGYVIWSETFAHRANDLFGMQDEVAAGVIRRALPGVKAPPRVMPPGSAAYEAYLRGRYFVNRQSADGYRTAIRYFEEVNRLEPDFAPAYAGLADTYWRSVLWEAAPPIATNQRAKEAATHALDLDPDSPDVHASLGSIHLNFDWDWAAAETELKRALAIRPDHANAHHWLSHLYIALGRFPESLEHSRAAVRLEPLDMPISVHIAWHYYYQGDPAESVRLLERSEQIDPGFAQLHHFRGMALIELGRQAEAVAALKKSLDLGGPNPERIGWLGYALALMGDKAGAQQSLEQLTAAAKKRYVSPHSVALVQLGLGNRSRALTLLQTAFEERSSLMANLAVEPAFRPLRSDPGFQALRSRMKFPA